MRDNESTPNDRGHGAFIVYGIAAVLFLYFGFFGAILLDEGVFHTNWMSGTMRRIAPDLNDSISEAIRTIYAPLISIFNRLAAIPICAPAPPPASPYPSSLP